MNKIEKEKIKKKKVEDKKYRLELTEAIRNLEKALAKAKANMKVNNEAGGKAKPLVLIPKPKLWAGKGKVSSCLQHFTSDWLTDQNQEWLLEMLSSVMGVEVSRSVLVRRALAAYRVHFEDLLCTGIVNKKLNTFFKMISQERTELYKSANRKELPTFDPKKEFPLLDSVTEEKK